MGGVGAGASSATSSAQLLVWLDAAIVLVKPVSVSAGSRGTSTQPSAVVADALGSHADSATALAAPASIDDCSGMPEGESTGSAWGTSVDIAVSPSSVIPALTMVGSLSGGAAVSSATFSTADSGSNAASSVPSSGAGASSRERLLTWASNTDRQRK